MSFAAFSEVQKYEKIESFRGTPLGEFIALPRPPSLSPSQEPHSASGLEFRPFWPDLQCRPVKLLKRGYALRGEEWGGLSPS